MPDKTPTRRDILGAAGALATVAATARAHAATPTPTRLKKIGLEEHFILPDFIDYLAETKQNIRPELFSRAVPRLLDFGAQRLELMDANGVDYVVLGLSGPGVQVEKDTATALRMARSANDRLAAEVHKRPDRYGGFAHLAMQDPRAAADELERCVRQFGFPGAMINGATLGVYLDDRRYDVFWERVEALQAPIYIHPANPIDKPHMYGDHPELWGPTWSWTAETCTHALRLIFSGTFDRYPGAKVILGHMGETLPIQLWRFDSRYPISNQRYAIKRRPSDYCRDNIFITTSGVCSDPAVRCALDSLGPRNVMFSIDFPFEDTKTACDWIETATVSAAEREAVAHGNAQALLKLTI